MKPDRDIRLTSKAISMLDRKRQFRTAEILPYVKSVMDEIRAGRKPMIVEDRPEIYEDPSVTLTKAVDEFFEKKATLLIHRLIEEFRNQMQEEVSKIMAFGSYDRGQVQYIVKSMKED
jgi:hypothetical protein